MTKRIWAGLLALGMALTALPSGMYAEETVWEEEANASEETLDGGLDESAEEFADGLPDYIPEPETDVVDGAADDESADELSEQKESLIEEEATPDLPDFIPEEEPLTLEESEPLGKYGKMRKKYLKENRNPLYQAMLLKGTLDEHLAEIDRTANSRLDLILPKMMAEAGVTEELKAQDQMKWVGLMNNLKQSAEEIIQNELIFN